MKNKRAVSVSHGVTTNACNRPWSEFEQPVDRPSHFDRPRNKRWIFKCLVWQREFQVEKCTYRRCTGKDYMFHIFCFLKKNQLLFHNVGRKKVFLRETNILKFQILKTNKSFHVSVCHKSFKTLLSFCSPFNNWEWFSPS